MLFQLVTVTPYRLRYLCTTESDPVLSINTGFIPNQLGPTVDLRTDTLVWLGYPIQKLVSTPAPTSLDAETLIQGVSLITVPKIEVARAHMYIHQRNTAAGPVPIWSCVALEGAAAGLPLSAGFAVIKVQGPTNGTGGQTAYLTIDFEHTYDR